MAAVEHFEGLVATGDGGGEGEVHGPMLRRSRAAALTQFKLSADAYRHTSTGVFE